MPVPTSSLQSVNPSPIIELFELTLDPVLHGTTTIQDPGGNNIATIRFHNNTIEIERSENAPFSIFWNGNTYYKMPIEVTGFKYDPKQLPRPTMTISNLAIIALNIGNMSNVLNAVNQVTPANDLVGATLKRRRTLAEFLPHGNFTGNNPYGTPDNSQEFPIEEFEIARKSIETRDIVSFELAASIDNFNVKLPKRQFLPGEFPGIGNFYN
jgi:lambda family phage minor tail protein L